MSRCLFGLRALTLTASLLAGSAAALGQDQKPTEEDHGQHQQPGNDPQDHSQYDMSKMAGMDHSAMGHSGMNSSAMFLMNESSGTGIQPAAWPMPMLMTRAGDWHLMWMGQAFILDTQQSGPRGGDKLYSVNWGMLGAVHKLGRGSFMLRSMLSLEPATVTDRRYQGRAGRRTMLFLWLPANELLKTRIVPNRVPFPSVFQIVNRDAVVNAVHRSRRFQKSLD